VNKLIRYGHRLRDIENYTLDQFVIFLDAAEQIEAADRRNFVVDMSTVVGSLFSKKSPIKEHLDLLTGIASGESDGSE